MSEIINTAPAPKKKVKFCFAIIPLVLYFLISALGIVANLLSFTDAGLHEHITKTFLNSGISIAAIGFLLIVLFFHKPKILTFIASVIYFFVYPISTTIIQFVLNDPSAESLNIAQTFVYFLANFVMLAFVALYALPFGENIRPKTKKLWFIPVVIYVIYDIVNLVVSAVNTFNIQAEIYSDIGIYGDMTTPIRTTILNSLFSLIYKFPFIVFIILFFLWLSNPYKKAKKPAPPRPVAPPMQYAPVPPMQYGMPPVPPMQNGMPVQPPRPVQPVQPVAPVQPVEPEQTAVHSETDEPKEE